MKKTLLILFTTLTLNAQERIITLSPAINEIVFALGAGDTIVGNTHYATYPEASKKIPKVGGFFSPSLEKIIAFKPTLVIMQQNNQQLSQKLQRLGITTKMIKIDKLSSIKEAILEIGKVVKQEKKAQTIVNTINTALEKLKGIVNHKKILIVFGRNTDLSKNVFIAGQNLYYDEIINQSGNINALQSNRKGQPILNIENIIACNPDIVLLLARSQDDNITDEALIKPWLELPISAARTKAIYINPNNYAGLPSDRLVLFLRDFREVLEDYKEKLNHHEKLVNLQ